MGTLIPQTRDEWMRWIERRVTAQERRTNSNPSAVDPLQTNTQRWAGRLNADFSAGNNVLYNVGFNVTLPWLHRNDGLFTYRDLGGGRIGVAVSRPGLYYVQCSLQWAGAGANSGSRKLYLLRGGQLVGDFNDERGGAPAGMGLVNHVTGIFNLAAGEGVAVYAKQNSGGVASGLTMVGAGTAGDPASLSTFVMYPIGASTWEV